MLVRKKNRTDPVTGKLVYSLQVSQHGRWVNLARPGGKVVFATEAEREAHLKTMKNVQLDGEESKADAVTEIPAAKTGGEEGQTESEKTSKKTR